MGVIVSFVYSQWAARYPELQPSVPEPLATEYFNEATLYLANDGSGRVKTTTAQLALLNMLTAHIAQLNVSINGVAPNNAVGRVSNATEGSVSATLENDYPPGSPQWYQQTKYGAAFWAASASYRTALYRASPGRSTNPFFNTGGWGF